MSNAVTNLKSVPHKVSELVAYQDGSVVSREIVRTTKTTVTAFAFDKDQGLSEHTTPFVALVQIVEGKAKITIRGVEHIVGEGEVVVMPANVPHALLAVEPFKMLLTMAK
jgi:quercetin dioxygenase-like cupin family protein